MIDLDAQFQPNQNAGICSAEEESKKQRLFIWIDILGFSNLLNEERNYERLLDVINAFRSDFKFDEFESDVISDGIILMLKKENGVDSDFLEECFDKIKKRQVEFITKKRIFLRGALATGTKLKLKQNPNQKNLCYIANGLSRAYKLEESMSWPIIGTNQKFRDSIERLYPGNYKEIFSTAYNAEGEKIFFLDFFSCANEFEREKLFNLVKYEIEREESTPKIKAKYRWLYKYFESRGMNYSRPSLIEGDIL